jgi:hypothetical protein
MVVYFLLVDHNDWSKWFAINSSHIYVVPATILLVGLPKKKTKLRHLILLSKVMYRTRVEMCLVYIVNPLYNQTLDDHALFCDINEL